MGLKRALTKAEVTMLRQFSVDLLLGHGGKHLQSITTSKWTWRYDEHFFKVVEKYPLDPNDMVEASLCGRDWRASQIFWYKGQGKLYERRPNAMVNDLIQLKMIYTSK